MQRIINLSVGQFIIVTLINVVILAFLFLRPAPTQIAPLTIDAAQSYILQVLQVQCKSMHSDLYSVSWASYVGHWQSKCE